MAMNGNGGGSAYPPNQDVKSGSCLIAGFQPLTVVHPTYWNAYKTESGATFSIDMVRLKLSFINGRRVRSWRTRGLLEGLRAVPRALTDENARLYLKARKSPQKQFLGAS